MCKYNNERLHSSLKYKPPLSVYSYFFILVSMFIPIYQGNSLQLDKWEQYIIG
ncbi:MAG: hypothetical protein M1276_01190 [Deltaproteobacteria bacterium]|nr:hypothetical protein [Deltaproteobacteria bacterium]